MLKQYPDLPLLDADGLHRIPNRLYLWLLVLLRPYVFWIIALLMPQQQTDVLGFWYPYSDDFLIALAIGFPALLVLVAITQRVPLDVKKSRGRAKWLWYGIWRHSKWWLTLSVLADMSAVSYALTLQGQAHQPLNVLVVLLLAFGALWVVRSRQLTLVFAEWPEDKRPS